MIKKWVAYERERYIKMKTFNLEEDVSLYSLIFIIIKYFLLVKFIPSPPFPFGGQR
jgi:hypothetical protein